MAVEVKPGVWAATFAKLDAQGQMKGRVAIEKIAQVIEKQAKTNASVGSHRYGTPTPASPGTGPAVISGNLRRSITHSPVVTLGPGHYQTKVGTAVGFTPPYGGTSRTPANKYGYYLEHGLKNGTTYPFLVPAFKWAVGTPAKAIFDAAYGSRSWAKVT